jgi:hypothetical protein
VFRVILGFEKLEIVFLHDDDSSHMMLLLGDVWWFPSFSCDIKLFFLILFFLFFNLNYHSHFCSALASFCFLHFQALIPTTAHV